MPNTLFSLILYLLKPYKNKFLFSCFLLALLGLIPSVDGYVIKSMLDYIEKNAANPEAKFAYNLFLWALFYGFWWELINWIWRLYDYIYMHCYPKLKANAVDEYYSYVQHHSFKFFKKNLAGYITSRIVDAARSLEMILCTLSEKIFRKIFTLGGAIITLYFVNPTLSTIFILWLLTFFSLNAIFADRIKALSMDWAKDRALISGKIVDAVSNSSSVRNYNNFEYERRHLGTFLSKMVKSEKSLNWFMLKIRYFQGLSCSIMIFLMLYYLSSLHQSGNITIGDYALVISLSLAVADDIWDFSQELGDLFEEIGVFAQSISLLAPHSIHDSEDSKDLKITKGKIEFLDVTFNYKRNKNIFEKKSVIINPNEKVGLVGYSGSGKTTFINLITRMYDLSSGVIKIDDQDISSVTQTSLRNQICVIPQEPILFNRSIFDNIRYGKLNATDEEVYSAARKAYIHDDIMNMPEKYETLCGEKGQGLSGGQRQRIAIARAILKDAPILILDEATSALDTITEKQIQKSLDFLMRNKTVLVIAHRLSTLENMDRILVFEKGSIKEDGTHAKLLKNGKIYRTLWESQISGFIRDYDISDRKL